MKTSIKFLEINQNNLVPSDVFQVSEKLKALQAERDKLEEKWKQKQSWLGNVHLEQVFYRDVNSMDKTSGSQEVHTSAVCFSKTVQ